MPIQCPVCHEGEFQCAACGCDVPPAEQPQPPQLTPMGPFFGQFFDHLRKAQAPGGSELGLGLTLFALTASIRASRVVEIGRYRGFATLAIASAFKLLDEGWLDHQGFRGRPDVDYGTLEAQTQRICWSIDPVPIREAEDTLIGANVAHYVRKVDCKSEDAEVPPDLDLIFIDGDHGYEACLNDVERFVPALRPGGLFVMHDYFGWFDANGRNGSRIRDAVHLLRIERFPRYALIDTGYPSFVVFHKPDPKRD